MLFNSAPVRIHCVSQVFYTCEHRPNNGKTSNVNLGQDAMVTAEQNTSYAFFVFLYVFYTCECTGPTMDNETYSRLVLGDNNTDNVKPRIKSSVVTGDPSRFGLTSQSAEDATEVKAFCGWDSDSPVNEHAPSFAENAHRLRRMPLTTTTPSKESSQTIELNQPRVNMVTVDLSRFGLTKESSQNNTTTVNIDEGHVAPEQEANMDPNRKPFDPPLPNMPRTLAETRDFLRKRHLASSSSSSSSSSFSYPQVPAAMAKFDKDGFPIDTEENLNDSLSIDKKKGI